MYTTSWCGDCIRVKQWLQAHDYQADRDYLEINIEHHPDSIAKVEEINHGQRSVPTLVFSDGSTITEPSNQQLAEKLERLAATG